MRYLEAVHVVPLVAAITQKQLCLIVIFGADYTLLKHYQIALSVKCLPIDTQFQYLLLEKNFLQYFSEYLERISQIKLTTFMMDFSHAMALLSCIAHNSS